MTLALCALLLVAQTQRSAYGSPADMKGLTKVFVDTDGNLTERSRIQDELRRSGLPLTLLDDVDDAEIILVFGTDRERHLGGWITDKNRKGDDVSTAVYQKVTTGRGQVFAIVGGRRRVVLSFEDDKRSVFERHPATNFARAFISAYSAANARVVRE
jgi:hypothetical protein